MKKKLSFNNARSLDTLSFYYSRELTTGEPDLSTYHGILAHAILMEFRLQKYEPNFITAVGPIIISHLQSLETKNNG